MSESEWDLSDFSWDSLDFDSSETNKKSKDEDKKTRRRTTECLELSQKYEYRRAFSEVKLLEAMKYEPLKKGISYNFITGGDVDGLSYLKIVLNQQNLEHCIFSTWCMAAEDILQFDEWLKSGRIKNLMPMLVKFFPIVINLNINKCLKCLIGTSVVALLFLKTTAKFLQGMAINSILAFKLLQI